jgi:hypothetical protein
LSSNVEDLAFERGIDICHETVRKRVGRFGPMFASKIRKRRVHAMRQHTHTIAVGFPASCSRSTPMICASSNLHFFTSASLGDGLSLNQGIRKAAGERG